MQEGRKEEQRRRGKTGKKEEKTEEGRHVHYLVGPGPEARSFLEDLLGAHICAIYQKREESIIHTNTECVVRTAQTSEQPVGLHVHTLDGTEHALRSFRP